MDSTLAQYGLSGVILWMVFKDIIKPMVLSFTKRNAPTPDPEKPWNPWQGKIEGRVTRLEDDVADMKAEQKEQTVMIRNVDRSLLKLSIHMNVPDED